MQTTRSQNEIECSEYLNYIDNVSSIVLNNFKTSKVFTSQEEILNDIGVQISKSHWINDSNQANKILKFYESEPDINACTVNKKLKNMQMCPNSDPACVTLFFAMFTEVLNSVISKDYFLQNIGRFGAMN